MRKAVPDDPGGSWLLNNIMFRTIGAGVIDGFAITNLVHDYDAMIYFQHTNPSTLLPF